MQSEDRSPARNTRIPPAVQPARAALRKRLKKLFPSGLALLEAMVRLVTLTLGLAFFMALSGVLAGGVPLLWRLAYLAAGAAAAAGTLGCGLLAEALDERIDQPAARDAAPAHRPPEQREDE